MDRPIKVLIVDDEQDILDTLAYSLALRGYVIMTAVEGGGKLVLPDGVTEAVLDGAAGL